MLLTRHQTRTGACWALDGYYLPQAFSLSLLLQLPTTELTAFLATMPKGAPAAGELLAPIEPAQEVWAAGVTYLRSLDARTRESEVKDVYDRVYTATRPELFFKCTGARARGHGMPIRIRQDGRWHVPEPELALVINQRLEIIGFTAGNDVSSRDIEGENPLYLPQAKVFNGSCAIGPGIELCAPGQLTDLRVKLHILRQGATAFEGETRTSQLKRNLLELAGFLGRELEFPDGVLLLTGTGIVPPDDFTLGPGDCVRIAVGQLTLENFVED